MLFQELGDVGLEQVRNVESLASKGAVHGLTGHVIPVGAGLVVSHQEQAVVQTVLFEPVDLTLDAGGHPDP